MTYAGFVHIRERQGIHKKASRYLKVPDIDVDLLPRINLAVPLSLEVKQAVLPHAPGHAA